MTTSPQPFEGATHVVKRNGEPRVYADSQESAQTAVEQYEALNAGRDDVEISIEALDSGEGQE